MWTSLESFMLSQALDTYVDLNKAKDTEWIHVLLAYLRTYIDNQGTDLLLHEVDKVTYITELVNGLKTAVSELETGRCSVIGPFFCFHVPFRSGISRPSCRVNGSVY